MAEQTYLKIGDISAYKISYDLGNKVWKIVSKWDYFAKTTIGKQLARSIDSISANIAEGFGRFHKKDRIKFYYNARGSVFEAQDWLKKAKREEATKDPTTPSDPGQDPDGSSGAEGEEGGTESLEPL